jgi:hypothetical protein
MKYSNLVRVLEGADKPTHTIEMKDGARVLILPHGGRILGLFSRSSEENFFWTHPALDSVDTASAFYSSGDWENSGGDRTWLAPEIDLFFPHFPDVSASGYTQPRSLDPGSYRLLSFDRRMVLTQQFDIRFFRTKSDMRLEISKWLEPSTDPLGIPELGGAEFAGYEQHTVLKILSGGPGRVGLWDLLQMPHHGEMLIPTLSKEAPKVYFGHVDWEDLSLNENCIRWKMHAAGEQKIGIRALQTIGRIGYLYSSGFTSNLIVRNFAVNPAGPYIDVPWSDHRDEGYALQACNVNSHLGTFSELEYHAPAIGAEPQSLHCEDVSQLWCYRGDPATIRAVAFRLLGVS